MRHWAEELARDYLLTRGYRLMAENVAFRGAELDLVLEDGPVIVFVEVRQRSRSDYGTAAESIDGRKLERMRRAARLYLARAGMSDRDARLDAVLVQGNQTNFQIEHVEGIG